MIRRSPLGGIRLSPRAVTILSTVVAGLAVWLGYQYGGEKWAVKYWILGFTVYLILSLLIQLYGAKQLRIEGLEDLFEDVLSSTVTAIELYLTPHYPNQDLSIRAYVMLYNAKDRKLRIQYSINLEDPEKRLALEKWQGLQGIAFGYNKAKAGTYDPSLPIGHMASWGLLAEHRALIPEDVRSCLAYPLTDQSNPDGPPLGVLYADSIHDLDENHTAMVLNTVKDHASILSHILDAI